MEETLWRTTEEGQDRHTGNGCDMCRAEQSNYSPPIVWSKHINIVNVNVTMLMHIS